MHKVKICTPFYNEWNQHKDGTIVPNNSALEQCINKLAGESYQAGKVYRNDTFDWTWQRCRTTYIDSGRNTLINGSYCQEIDQTIEGDWTHFFLLDSDISGDFYTIISSLLQHDLLVVGGAYEERKRKSYCGGELSEDGTQGDFVPLDTRGLVQVGWVGNGATLIKREVFETIKYPYFEDYYLRYESNGKQCAVAVKDDVCFGNKCREAGIDIFMDCNINVNHMEKSMEEQNAVQEQAPEVNVGAQRKVTDLSVSELKELAYDTMATIEKAQMNLKVINDLIRQKSTN